MFEQRVAHGYFIMSIAAGLFVDSYEKNPVLLNYGIDELRFTKPVYPGTGIHIRFYRKEKLPNDKRVIESRRISSVATTSTKGIVKVATGMIDRARRDHRCCHHFLPWWRNSAINTIFFFRGWTSESGRIIFSQDHLLDLFIRTNERPISLACCSFHF